MEQYSLSLSVFAAFSVVGFNHQADCQCKDNHNNVDESQWI
jgi:hypothetical protein